MRHGGRFRGQLELHRSGQHSVRHDASWGFQVTALDMARAVKAGWLTRNAAIQRYRELNKCTFMDALMEIDIAIGDINEGIV